MQDWLSERQWKPHQVDKHLHIGIINLQCTEGSGEGQLPLHQLNIGQYNAFSGLVRRVNKHVRNRLKT